MQKLDINDNDDTISDAYNTPVRHKSVRNLVSLFRSKSEHNPMRIRKLQLNSKANKIVDQYLNEDTLCYVCGEKVYLVERLNIMGTYIHPNCFRCSDCDGSLRSALYFYKKDPKTSKSSFSFKLFNNKHTFKGSILFIRCLLLQFSF
jgi:hypothetical protein